MLSAVSYPTTAPHAYLPQVPSPLSPRSANIYGRRRTSFMSSSPSASEAESVRSNHSISTKSRDLPFSKRAVKKAPSPKQDELKDRRRNMFLKKVREEREERRFETRGEDIMRLDFVQRQRQWEAQLASEAPLLDPSDSIEAYEEAEDDTFTSSGSSTAMQISAPSTQQPTLDYEQAEEVAQREQEELDYLIAYYTEPGLNNDEETGEDISHLRETMIEEYGDDLEDEHSQHLYSDDDDYDALFAEIVQRDVPQENMPPQRTNDDDDGEPMDMS